MASTSHKMEVSNNLKKVTFEISKEIPFGQFTKDLLIHMFGLQTRIDVNSYVSDTQVIFNVIRHEDNDYKVHLVDIRELSHEEAHKERLNQVYEQSKSNEEIVAHSVRVSSSSTSLHSTRDQCIGVKPSEIDACMPWEERKRRREKLHPFQTPPNLDELHRTLPLGATPGVTNTSRVNIPPLFQRPPPMLGVLPWQDDFYFLHSFLPMIEPLIKGLDPWHLQLLRKYANNPLALEEASKLQFLHQQQRREEVQHILQNQQEQQQNQTEEYFKKNEWRKILAASRQKSQTCATETPNVTPQVAVSSSTSQLHPEWHDLTNFADQVVQQLENQKYKKDLPKRHKRKTSNPTSSKMARTSTTPTTATPTPMTSVPITPVTSESNNESDTREQTPMTLEQNLDTPVATPYSTLETPVATPYFFYEPQQTPEVSSPRGTSLNRQVRKKSFLLKI